MILITLAKKYFVIVGVVVLGKKDSFCKQLYSLFTLYMSYELKSLIFLVTAACNY